MKVPFTLDLVLLVPDRDVAETMEGLISGRRESLQIRRIRFRQLVNVHRDPGCFHEAPDILQTFLKMARHALVTFDHEGSGQDDRPPHEVSADLKGRLTQAGWQDRAEVLVIEPELEQWVWSLSPQVDVTLGWKDRDPPLRTWLEKGGLWPQGAEKPQRPKESMQAALRAASIRRSPSIYRQLAETVGLDRCQDPSFLKFKSLMKSWFPVT